MLNPITHPHETTLVSKGLLLSVKALYDGIYNQQYSLSLVTSLGLTRKEESAGPSRLLQEWSLWCHRQQGTYSPGTFPWQIGSLLSPSRPQMRTEEHSPPGRRHPRPRRHLHKEVMGEELAAPLPTSSLAVMDASPTMDRKEKVHPREGHL